MFAKIKTIEYRLYLEQLHDVRAVGLIMFLIVVLLVSWSGIKAVQTNYILQRQISQLDQEVQVQQLENNNLKLQNQYLSTDQYLELSARQNFGLGAPGETEIIVPHDVALAHVVTPKQDNKPTNPTSKQPFYQRNFEAWISFFFHRQNFQ